MDRTIEQLLSQGLSEIASAHDRAALESVRVAYLGKKGQLTALLKQLGTLSPEARPRAGQALNQAKARLQTAITERQASWSTSSQTAIDAWDVTLPGRGQALGGLHPLTSTRLRIERFFTRLGFSVVEGPDVETEYHNFNALNIPADHPARDLQDTFYFEHDRLLRTHTSSVQIRAMAERRPPVRLIASGRAYRMDDVDATHTPMFHQLEGLCIDESVTMADLKTTLLHFLRYFFDRDVNMRFRTGFFPFTEPSAEVDVRCMACDGQGCPVCKQTGWVELLGCGMVHPQVLRAMDLDPQRHRGWAFGLGIERLCMFRHGIDDIRLFYQSDLKFLSQFVGTPT